MLYFFILQIRNMCYGQEQKEIEKKMPYDRRIKINNYRNDTDKLLSLYSAALTYMCISEITGINIKQLNIVLGKYGKPFLLNRNVHFNYSHSRSVVCCAISMDNPVGVDIEYLSTLPRNIMERVLHKKEIEYINNTKGESKAKSFYEIWTKKEAYLKRLGTGLIDNISTINVLEECMENKLHTGWFGDYVWTVCHKTCNMVYKVVDEKDIWNYYNKTVKDTI